MVKDILFVLQQKKKTFFSARNITRAASLKRNIQSDGYLEGKTMFESLKWKRLVKHPYHLSI